MTQQITSGTLVLLGGEGIRVENTPLWQRLIGNTPGGLSAYCIVPTALGEHKVGTAQRRAQRTAKALSALDLEPSIIPILNREDAANPEHISDLGNADAIHLLGGDTRTLVSTLKQTEAWRIILTRHQEGATLIASGGAAVALTEQAFAPVQPHPAALDDLEYEVFAGLGLLRNIVILPYFSWLQPRVIDSIRAVLPVDTWLTGIDDQSALIARRGSWSAAGLGSITIWTPAGTRYVFDAGNEISIDLSPLSI